MNETSTKRMLLMFAGRRCVAIAITALGLVMLCFVASPAAAQIDDDPYTSTVGFPKQINNIQIAGARLQASPIQDREQPIIVRIVDWRPHGAEFMYDLEYTGLESGSRNLVDFLVRVNGETVDNVPPIKVQINTLLPSDQITPSPMAIAAPRYHSFYIPTAIALGLLWLCGLIALMLVGRKKRQRASKSSASPVTLADRLRPLVRQAMDGTIDTNGQAQLDRLITSYWRQKLKLEDLSAPDLRDQLRQHPESSQALAQLDRWLYAPADSADSQVDINELLSPYENVEIETDLAEGISTRGSTASAVTT